MRGKSVYEEVVVGAETALTLPWLDGGPCFGPAIPPWGILEKREFS